MCVCVCVCVCVCQELSMRCEYERKGGKTVKEQLHSMHNENKW